MASFIAYIPRPSVKLTTDTLTLELNRRGLSCHLYRDIRGTQIEFDASADLLYMTIKDGVIDYLEHAPSQNAGHIPDALSEIGLGSIDEDDPRWREV